jgi:hypothetical protein
MDTPTLEEIATEYEQDLMALPGIDQSRKKTGSHYTPSSLVECLIDSTLQPLIDERLTAPTPRQRIDRLLQLTVCDPACGSGAFPIAAARRIAASVAAQGSALLEPDRRTPLGQPDPSPEVMLSAIRSVTACCIYGVDLSESAAELCKVALWAQAFDPDAPHAFLDHHIRVGNALIGATPALIAGGIPDDAFKPIEGDDKQVAAALRRRNKAERDAEQASRAAKQLATVGAGDHPDGRLF